MFHNYKTSSVGNFYGYNCSQPLLEYAMTLFGNAGCQCYGKWESKQSIGVIDALMVKFHMDDYLDSFNDASEAIARVLSIVTYVSNGVAHLTKRKSNSTDIIKRLPPLISPP